MNAIDGYCRSNRYSVVNLRLLLTSPATRTKSTGNVNAFPVLLVCGIGENLSFIRPLTGKPDDKGLRSDKRSSALRRRTRIAITGEPFLYPNKNIKKSAKFRRFFYILL